MMHVEETELRYFHTVGGTSFIGLILCSVLRLITPRLKSTCSVWWSARIPPELIPKCVAVTVRTLHLGRCIATLM